MKGRHGENTRGRDRIERAEGHPRLAGLPRPAEHNVTIRPYPSGQRALRRRHPWLFESGIRDQSHAGRAGDFAVVFDRARKFLAIGLYDPASPIRVRVVHAGKPTPIDAAFFARRFRDLVARRASLAAGETDGYRVVHGDNESMGGLVVDRYADTLVAKLYTPVWVPQLSTVIPALLAVVPATRVVLRWGREAFARTAERFGLEDGEVIVGPPLDGPVVFREHGLRFECDPVRGQKTGFFLDQRDNRARVGELARGRDVLDVFAYTGGFSLAAARGGARRVTSIDRSGHALAAAERNFALNRDVASVAGAEHVTLRGDAFEAMRGLSASGRRFDLVVVDPPAFAKRASEVSGALAAYGVLARSALELVREDGLLVMASCSARVSRDAFFDTLHRVATSVGRPLAELERTAAPLDHPVGFAEGAYLKCLYARVPGAPVVRSS